MHIYMLFLFVTIVNKLQNLSNGLLLDKNLRPKFNRNLFVSHSDFQGIKETSLMSDEEKLQKYEKFVGILKVVSKSLNKL